MELKNAIYLTLTLIVIHFWGQVNCAAQSSWEYIYYEGTIADDVPAYCHSDQHATIEDLTIPISEEEIILAEKKNEALITINCSFGIIDAEVALQTDFIAKNDESVELKGKLKNSDYFSSWQGILKDDSFSGFLYAYGEQDSVAFSLNKNDLLVNDFEIFTFKEELNVLEKQMEVDGILQKTLKVVEAEEMFNLNDKEGEHITYNSLSNQQKVHIPKTENPKLKELYFTLYHQSANNQNYVIDETRFKDSINSILATPLQELCEAKFNDDKIRFSEELEAEDYIPVMNDYKLKTQIKYNNKEMIGVCFESYTYNGGAHGLPHADCYNLNVRDAKIIQLGDLFEDGTACTFNKLLKREIANYAKSNKIGYIIDLTSNCDGNYYDLDFPDSFYINEAGITMVYPVYSLFAFSDGIVSINVPAADLNTITKKESIAWKLWFEE